MQSQIYNYFIDCIIVSWNFPLGEWVQAVSKKDKKKKAADTSANRKWIIYLKNYAAEIYIFIMT